MVFLGLQGINAAGLGCESVKIVTSFGSFQGGPQVSHGSDYMIS
jgi:hypothetical protein